MKMTSVMDSPKSVSSDGELVDFVVDLMDETDTLKAGDAQSRYQATAELSLKLEEALQQLSAKDDSIKSLTRNNGRLGAELALRKDATNVVVEEKKVITAKWEVVTSRNLQLNTRIEEMEAEMLRLKEVASAALDSSSKNVESGPAKVTSRVSDDLVELSVRLVSISRSLIILRRVPYRSTMSCTVYRGGSCVENPSTSKIS